MQNTKKIVLMYDIEKRKSTIIGIGEINERIFRFFKRNIYAEKGR